MADEFQYLFKIIIVGDSGVGKSSILNRYTKDVFNFDMKATIGVEFNTKNVTVYDKINIRAQIWDTAGQERYRAVTQTYYKGAYGALLVYDVSKPASFTNAEKWLNEMREHADEGLCVILVGNKSDLRSSDLPEVVRTEDAEDFAKKHGLGYIESSAKANANITQAFELLVQNIYDTKKAAGELDEEDFIENAKVNTKPLHGEKIRIDDKKADEKPQKSSCC